MTPLDAKWYDQFLPFAQLKAYEYFNGQDSQRQQQKEAFLRGDIENPSFDYPEIDADLLRQLEVTLSKLEETFLAEEKNELVVAAYRELFSEKMAHIRLLLATHDKDMAAYQRYCEFIYGHPSSDVFSYTLHYLHAQVTEKMRSSDNVVRQAAQNLQRALPSELPYTKAVSLPPQECLTQVGLIAHSLLHYLLPDEHPSGEIVGAEYIRQDFIKALGKLPPNDWQVVIGPEHMPAINVHQERRQIIIPSSRQLTKRRLTMLIVHEVGTHVARTIYGEQSPLKILGRGLDRYERGEEGLALIWEQGLKRRLKDFGKISRHLAISLSLGLDGTPRDFRQVYEIMEKYFIYNFTTVKKREDINERAQGAAWRTCLRIFRGTDCSTRGVCFTKDIMYREGNIDLWRLLEQDSNLLHNVNQGSYDPTNSRHRQIVEEVERITVQPRATATPHI